MKITTHRKSESLIELPIVKVVVFRQCFPLSFADYLNRKIQPAGPPRQLKKVTLMLRVSGFEDTAGTR
jgi:hypothetical protein